MFGWKDDPDRVRKLAHALSHPLKPEVIPQDKAPCQEAVIEHPNDVNPYMVPIRHTAYESGAHGRLRHPLRDRGAVRRRVGPRLQPHELPLGQRRNVPDLARLAHVAGGQQILRHEGARSDHHVLRRAAGLHADGRRRIRLRDPAQGLRRNRRRRRGARRADPPGEGAHGRCHGARRRRDRARRLRRSARPALRDARKRGGGACRAATTSTPNGPATWARRTRRRLSTSPR